VAFEREKNVFAKVDPTTVACLEKILVSCVASCYG
jgi:hypothetical protein